MSIAQTFPSFPTTAPSTWTDPAILPYVMTCLLVFAAALLGLWLWAKGRMDRQSERIKEAQQQAFTAALHATPPGTATTPRPERP